MNALSSERRLSGPSRWIVGLALILGLLATTGLTILRYRDSRRASLAEDIHVIDGVHARIAERLSKYDTLLRGGKGLWLSADYIESRQWRAFMDGFDWDDAGGPVQTFGFAVYGDPDGMPMKPDSDPRDFSARIRLVEPFSTTRELQEFDLAAHPGVREAALESIVDDRVKVVRGAPFAANQGALATILAPVRRKSNAKSASFEGWVFMTIRIDAAIANPVGDFGGAVSLEIGADGGSIGVKSAPRSATGATIKRPLPNFGGGIVANYQLPPRKSEWAPAVATTVTIGLLSTIALASVLSLAFASRRSAILRASIASEKLAESRRTVATRSSILEQVDHAVFEINASGVKWMNASARRLVDPAGQVSFGDLMDESRIDSLMREVAENGSTRFEVALPDGRLLLCSASSLASESGFVLIAADVTEHARQERELTIAREDAETASAMKSKFLANMSHELRTPLNGIIGMAQLLKNTRLEAEQADCVQTIVASGEGLLTLLNDLLDISKIESGRFELSVGEFSLREVVEGAVSSIANLAAKKGIDLVIDVKEGADAQVIGDATRVRQMALNLVGNAIKFTETGEVVVIVDLERVGDEAEVAIVVRDTGIGIPADRLDQIFENFSQVDAGISRKYGGTGLGLAITRNLARMMGGDATVRSVAGEGSTFVVRFRTQWVGSRRPKPVETVGLEWSLKIDNLWAASAIRRMGRTLGIEERAGTPRIAS